MEEKRQPTYEFRLGSTGPRLRFIVEDDREATPITPVRHDDDVFFLAPDSRVVAALVQMAPTT